VYLGVHRDRRPAVRIGPIGAEGRASAAGLVDDDAPAAHPPEQLPQHRPAARSTGDIRSGGTDAAGTASAGSD
jgi:hypothetical protein